jgi:hypothetical protein
MSDVPKALGSGDGSEIDSEDERRLVLRYHLGAITEASASVEYTLRAIVASLLGSPRATVVAAGQSVTWLVQNALAVIDANDDVRGPALGDPRKVARFRAAVKECGDLYAMRNQLIHGAWLDGGPGLTQVRSKWRKPWPSAVEVQLEDIEGLARDLNDAVNELLEASFEIKGIVAGT